MLGYLPYYPSEVSETSTKRLVEYDPEDTEGWVTVPEVPEEDSSWSNVFGVQVRPQYSLLTKLSCLKTGRSRPGTHPS